jgi:two-component system OmpR family response regulator
MRFEEPLKPAGTAFSGIRRQTGYMRILVVEDDGLTASALERGLAAEGYAVEVASDGIDGLHRAREFSYDAMILDLMLPGISGLAVCSELRAAGRDLPVLMLTALGDPADHTAGLDIGADDYIVKPFKFPVLLAHLRALLRRGPARLPAVLRNGGLALDPASHVCTKDGCILDLTPREFAVLRYLMSHAGTAVSKQELLDHVWGENDSADHNIVQVYVSSLRRKIGSEGPGSLIETVRGVGYRMRGGT